MKIQLCSINHIFNKLWENYVTQRKINTYTSFQDWVTKHCQCEITESGVTTPWEHEFLIFKSEIEYHQFLLQWL